MNLNKNAFKDIVCLIVIQRILLNRSADHSLGLFASRAPVNEIVTLV